MKHAEAFCLMTYKCMAELCGNEEELWNTRDGVTPFTIDCKVCGSEAQHIDFQKDQFAPDYEPYEGQRIFIDMLEEKKRHIATKTLESYRGTPFEVDREDREKVIKQIMEGMPEGTPDVVTFIKKG